MWGCINIKISIGIHRAFKLSIFFFKQKTAYEMCGRDWSSNVCSSDLGREGGREGGRERGLGEREEMTHASIDSDQVCIEPVRQ